MARAALATPTLIRISTPSELSVTDAGVQADEDPDHPGDGWMLFDSNNPGHYQVIFNNEQGQPEVAKYIKYISVGDGMAVQGCRKKGTPAYGMALHARAFPNPNFSRPRIKDTDLSAFHPDSVNHLLVDNALVRLIDPGVVADVHTLRTQITKKKQIKRQRMELDAQEREADGKMVFVERYLVHGRARSRIQDHLMTTRPPSPPANFVPRIFAAQGPPESEWTPGEGRDSMECRAVRKSRIRSLPGTKRKREKSPSPYPYCLHCNEESPNHYQDDCPLWKVCRWCLAIDHAHDECPTPHQSCTEKRCLVPSWHPRATDYCPISLQEYSYDMRCAAADNDDLDDLELQFE